MGVLLLAMTACAGADRVEKKTLVVFAAASLQATFAEVEAEFEAENPGVDVKLSFGGSSDLVTQILGEAPVDVFASADLATMAKLGDRAIDPQDFATNTLQIVVPPGNPAGIETFDDLAAADLRLVVCAADVPCGSATQKVAAAAGVELSPDSQEQSVTDVLGKVVAGEADAGLVYVTDVAAAGDTVEGIAFPEAASVVNTYPIARVQGAEQEELARAFIEMVLGETGRRVLGDAGFGTP
ncbi:molybdate ABC transporter substrate-binding protein [Aeromicrobium sp. Sec7.5]|uniref:molybdate ABC transporter substrate-binding protein n=1 Tax=Aeromicrobium sp. Sec7.5 TaxID=3121276 RepID=UPI002FE4DF06